MKGGVKKRKGDCNKEKKVLAGQTGVPGRSSGKVVGGDFGGGQAGGNPHGRPKKKTQKCGK